MLTKLPNEIKEYIQDGIYTLYEVRNKNQEFVLVTDDLKYIALNYDGDKPVILANLTGYELGKHITLGSPVTNSTQIVNNL